MEKINIANNFLAKEEFDTLRDTITQYEFPWYFSRTVVDKEEISPGGFSHKIYLNNIPCSSFYNFLVPTLDQLNCAQVYRIRINLNPRLSESYVFRFHSDLSYDLGEDVAAQWTTSILYINTNNGYTELESGERIESIANRLVSFPANTRHRAVTQTDEQTRILINFNYLKAPSTKQKANTSSKSPSEIN